MALSDFLRINLPYGMRKNDRGEWMFFNREYTSLGNSLNETIDEHSSYYCSYTGITNELLEELAEGRINTDEKGECSQLWFYDDRTNPYQGGGNVIPELWDKYVNKLRLLSGLDRKI